MTEYVAGWKYENTGGLVGRNGLFVLKSGRVHAQAHGLHLEW